MATNSRKHITNIYVLRIIMPALSFSLSFSLSLSLSLSHTHTHTHTHPLPPNKKRIRRGKKTWFVSNNFTSGLRLVGDTCEIYCKRATPGWQCGSVVCVHWSVPADFSALFFPLFFFALFFKANSPNGFSRLLLYSFHSAMPFDRCSPGYKTFCY